MTGDRTDSTGQREVPGEGTGTSASGTELTWLGAADDVLDSVVERDDVLEARFEDLVVEIPLRMGPDADRAEWRLDGTVRVTVEGESGPLADWLRWWYTRTRRSNG